MSHTDKKSLRNIIKKVKQPLSVVPPPAKVIVHPSVPTEAIAKPVDTTDPSDQVQPKLALAEQIRARYELFMNDCRLIDRQVDLSKQKYNGE